MSKAMPVSEKSWYQSKTIWAAIGTIIVSIIGFAGFSLSEGETEIAIRGMESFGVAFCAFVSIWGRFKANSAIKKPTKHAE